MTAKIFNISLPAELLEIVDKQASVNYQSRSEYVKAAILTRLKAEDAIDANGWRQRSPEEVKREQLRKFLASYDPNLLEDDLEWE